MSELYGFIFMWLFCNIPAAFIVVFLSTALCSDIITLHRACLDDLSLFQHWKYQAKKFLSVKVGEPNPWGTVEGYTFGSNAGVIIIDSNEVWQSRIIAALMSIVPVILALDILGLFILLVTTKIGWVMVAIAVVIVIISRLGLLLTRTIVKSSDVVEGLSTIKDSKDSKEGE